MTKNYFKNIFFNIIKRVVNYQKMSVNYLFIFKLVASSLASRGGRICQENSLKPPQDMSFSRSLATHKYPLLLYIIGKRKTHLVVILIINDMVIRHAKFGWLHPHWSLMSTLIYPVWQGSTPLKTRVLLIIKK